MRVLIVEAAGNLWGSERALLDLIDSAPELSFAVCCPPASPIIAELERRGVIIFPYFVPNLHQKSRWHRLRAAFGVLRACLRFRPELLHLNQSGAYRVVQVATHFYRAPIVCHVRIFEDAAYLAKASPVPDRLGAIIAISSAVESELRSYTQLDSIPVYRIYDAFACTAVLQPRGVRQPKVACVGRITPIKGQEVLVEALTSTDGFPDNAEFLFAGDGEKAYVEEIKARSIGSVVDVRWLGLLPDVSELLEEASVLACPSYREPLGRVIFEAWEAGLIPVVFAGSGGAAEIVERAGGGIVYHEQSASALGEAVRLALNLPQEEANRLVMNGRQWMRDNCNLMTYGASISKLFSVVVSEPTHIAERLES